MKKLLAFALCAACTDAPQSRVFYPAALVSSGTRMVTMGEWTLTLSRAELAFGPAYFCASASGSSTLCGTAIAELPAVVLVDALAPRAPLGTIDGLTGQIRSVAYDLGVLWLDTQPSVTPASQAPSGHSAILEGDAAKGDLHVPFTVLLDLAPQYQGQHAVATAPAVGEVDSDACTLEVHVDPVRWLAQVDFDAATKRPERPLVFGVGSPEHSAVVVGVQSLAPPEFHWVPTRPGERTCR